MGAILTSAMRVMNKTNLSLPRNCPEKRLADKVFHRAGTRVVADDLPHVRTLVSNEIKKPTLTRRNVGDFTQKDLTESCRHKFLRRQQVFCHQQRMPRIGCHFKPPPLSIPQPKLPAQPLDTIHSDLHPMIIEIGLQAFRAIIFSRAPMCGSNRDCQPRILLHPLGWGTVALRMVTACGGEGTAQQENRVFGPHIVPGSYSLTKYATAFLDVAFHLGEGLFPLNPCQLQRHLRELRPGFTPIAKLSGLAVFLLSSPGLTSARRGELPLPLLKWEGMAFMVSLANGRNAYEDKK